jgi:hypothetical protein
MRTEKYLKFNNNTTMEKAIKLSALDYILFDIVNNKPIESLDTIYHYTSVIEAVNNGLKLENNEMFISLTELPIELQNKIIETL